MMDAPTPGWNPDPSGRHEYRYWDGAAWTDDVADGGLTAVDPVDGPAPTGHEPTAAFGPIDGPAPSGHEPTAAFDPTMQHPPHQAPQQAPGGGAPYGYPAQPGPPGPGYGAGYDPAYGASGQVPPGRPPRSGPPIGLVVGLVLVGVALVVGLVVVLTRDDGETASTDTTTTTEATPTTEATSTTDATTTTTEATTTTTAGSETAGVFDITVGDCLTDEADMTGEVQEVPLVPCDQPHSSEIYHSHIIESGDLPDEAAMEALVADKCLTAFETFVGIPYEQSALTVTWLEPTEASWNAGDRELLCIARDPGGDVTGSLEGAAR